MESKKAGALVLLAVGWIGFIFYMSSQTAVNSGNISRAVTRLLLKAGEKAGIVSYQTAHSASQIIHFDSITRSVAHISMYFLLACVISIAFRLFGMKSGKSAAITILVCLAISILDELNQMNYTGRNDNGLAASGMEDIIKDVIGTAAALAVFFLIRHFRDSKKNIRHMN